MRVANTQLLRMSCLPEVPSVLFSSTERFLSTTPSQALCSYLQSTTPSGACTFGSSARCSFVPPSCSTHSLFEVPLLVRLWRCTCFVKKQGACSRRCFDGRVRPILGRPQDGNPSGPPKRKQSDTNKTSWICRKTVVWERTSAG